MSVIVPIYNVEGYLDKCIESIIYQSHKDIEIILINDGSNDSSGLICDKYAERDSRVLIIHKYNSGVVSSRKIGGQIATGEYIVSVDGDDWIEQNYIENFVKLIQQTKKDVIWSISYYKQNDRNEELILADVEKNIELGEIQEEILKKVKGSCGFQNDIEYSICNKCIRKELYNRVQSQVNDELSRGEDLYFSIVLLTNTNSFYFCRNDGYHYVKRSTSNTNNKSAYSDEKFKTLQIVLKNFSKELTKENETLNHIINGYLISTYMLFFFGTLQDTSIGYLYPFCKVKKSSKVVIYGAGSIGQNVIAYLSSSNNYNIVSWMDSNVVTNKGGMWKIQPIVRIVDMHFDFVILATNRTIYIKQMKDILKTLGIQDEKIVSPFDADFMWTCKNI